jgi:hypothetical protein
MVKPNLDTLLYILILNEILCNIRFSRKSQMSRNLGYPNNIFCHMKLEGVG